MGQDKLTLNKQEPRGYIYTPPKQLIWSEYQKAIFKNFAKETGHLIIEAYAGTSKTTSLIEGIKYFPKGSSILMLAFNKLIAKELQERASNLPKLEISTFHSLGFRSIKNRFGQSVKLDDNKEFKIVKNLVGDKFDLIINICQTISYCKYALCDLPIQIEDIIYKFDVDLCDESLENFINLTIKALNISKNETNIISFDDMCYFPFAHNLSVGQFDKVVVDEYQDLNLAQLFIAKKALKPLDGRLIMVGDENQNIYSSFRMTDSTVIEELKSNPKTKTLPLPISYRCPKSVINLAQNYVKNIQYAENAIEGEITDINLDKMYELAKPGCFILSRLNYPMLKICLNFIKLGIKANVRGRDVGTQLQTLIKKSKKKQINSFLTWLENWKDKELDKLKNKRLNTDSITDRFECLKVLCEESKSISDLTDKIDKLFSDTDEKNMVILSTTHRAKGLERDDVFILRYTYRIWLDNIKFIDEKNEEACIAYVAATRAKQRLFIVKK